MEKLLPFSLQMLAWYAVFFDPRWVDGFAHLPNAADVTIRQLLRHQTGIPRYVFEKEFWSAVLSDPEGDALLLAAGQR